MKKTILFFAAIISLGTVMAQVRVEGYWKKNGTYVPEHYRTAPNFTRDDNWSTIGNTNPYTGVEGTKIGGYNPSYFNSQPTFNLPQPDYNFSIPINKYCTMPSNIYTQTPRKFKW